MNLTTLSKITLSIIIILAILVPIQGQAESAELDMQNCQNRPISHFLNAQGTSSDFFPPVKDYVGWVDGGFNTFALVDYAALADTYLEDNNHSVGTRTKGFVIECERNDGKAQIFVSLITTKALGFAQSIADLAENRFDFLATPTIFGSKAQDVVNGADAATGLATLLTSFVIPAPGSQLPNFIDVALNNPESYAPVKFNFISKTLGKCSDGRRAKLNIHQTASTDESGNLIFSNEKVETLGAGGVPCGS